MREMHRLSVQENFGHKRTADRLPEGGYPTRNGRPWAAYTVQHILTNEALAGTLVYGKRPKPGNPAVELVRVEGFFPAILSGEEWAALEERLRIRRETPRGSTHKSDYLLSGTANAHGRFMRNVAVSSKYSDSCAASSADTSTDSKAARIWRTQMSRSSRPIAKGACRMRKRGYPRSAVYCGGPPQYCARNPARWALGGSRSSG